MHLLLCAILLLFGQFVIAQELPINDHFKRIYSIKSADKGVYVFQNRYTGKTSSFQFRQEASSNIVYPVIDTLRVDSLLTIKTWEVDTTQFRGRFRLMGTVPLNNRSEPLLVFDSNNNGIGEIVGAFQTPEMPYSFRQFYEWNPFLNNFELVFNAGVRARNWGGSVEVGADIDKDGLNEIYFSNAESLRVYESPGIGEYATVKRFVHYPTLPEQPSSVEIGDFDGDGRTEILTLGRAYDSTGTTFLGYSNTIREHVSGDSSFKVISNIIYPNSAGKGAGVFAVGDIDLDGQVEFFKGDIDGRILGIENVANDSFRLHWGAQIPSWNSWYHFSAGDMDGDGLPECFFGGSKFVDNTVEHLLTAVESTGNDAYEPVWGASVLGGGILDVHVDFGDVDGDSKNEFVWHIPGMVLVFKATGNNQFSLFWLKFLNASDGVTVGDVDGDGLDEIVVSTWPWDPIAGGLYTKAYIFKYNPYTPISGKTLSNITHHVELFSNYPNPFNPATTIRFTLSAAANIELSVLNIRGQVVAEILDERRSAGEHSVVFDASGLPSGIYFYRLSAGQYSKTRKMVVVR